jgi:hypothetical protein
MPVLYLVRQYKKVGKKNARQVLHIGQADHAIKVNRLEKVA